MKRTFEQHSLALAKRAGEGGPVTLQASAISDADIVRRVLAGDVASFEVLMRRHNRRVYRTLRAVLRRDSAEIEDAMQQTYLQAYGALATFAGFSSFATWLTRIAVNVALGLIRRERSAPMVLSLEVDETTCGELQGGPQGGPEDEASRRQVVALLERAVARLSDPHRVVFVLRDVEQLSTAEAAEALELTEANVKVRLHRARVALRALIAEESGLSRRRSLPPGSRRSRAAAIQRAPGKHLRDVPLAREAVV